MNNKYKRSLVDKKCDLCGKNFVPTRETIEPCIFAVMGVIGKWEEIMEKNFQNMAEQKRNIKYCKRCYRPLKDEKSRECGYGRICLQKIQINKINYLFEMKGDNNV